MTPLAAAKELVAVLEQLEATIATVRGLEAHRDELLAGLVDSGVMLGTAPTPAVKAPKAPEEGISTPPRRLKTKPSIEEVIARNPPLHPERSSAEILADDSLGHRTETEQAKIEDEAMDVYDANVQPASEAQRRMLFGTLGREFGVKGDDNLKHVIIELLAHQHHGEKIQSIREELSSPWASGLIDWLVNGDKAELKKLITGMEIPF